ncbi:MAG TPA: matrixin family metalloprotease [Polyangia bacterium]|jgi:MYXO-CTERM domain-containing protein|nr:matrixin family metalloprotease [Polyangia bacterium]
MRRRSLSLALIVATLAGAGVAQAYVRSRSADDKWVLIWPNPSITMTVRTGGMLPVSVDDIVGAATRAAATWSAPSNDTSVAYTVVTSPAAPVGTLYDHENTISFRSAGWDEADGYAADALALTTVWSQGGAILDADTEINNTDTSYTWAVLPDDPAAASRSPDIDLQNALTHELGHVIGLNHPCYLGDEPDPPQYDNAGKPVLSCSDPSLPASVRDATMYPSSLPGLINERALSDDERLALHDLYPAGRAPVVEIGSSDGCAIAGTGTTSRGGVALVGLAFALARRRRRVAVSR